jgi:UDP-N-acetylmuramoyl-tripeptide--D-alanyl-D-alanine ligase
VTHVSDAAAAKDALRAVIRPGDAILIKGSNSVGLSALVESFAGGQG